jgi:hypothetical protein
LIDKKLGVLMRLVLLWRTLPRCTI